MAIHLFTFILRNKNILKYHHIWAFIISMRFTKHYSFQNKYNSSILKTHVSHSPKVKQIFQKKLDQL
jgi:hypothetical protein